MLDNYGDPETPAEREQKDSACDHCHELLNREHNIFQADDVDCMIGKPYPQARRCWEGMARAVVA